MMNLVELVNKYCIEKADMTIASGERINFFVNLRKLTISPLIQEFSRLILGELTDEYGTNQYDALGCTEGMNCDLVIGCLACGPPTLRGGVIARDTKIKGTVKAGDRVIVLEGIAVNSYGTHKSVNTFAKFGCEVVEVVTIVELNDLNRLYCEGLGIRYQALVTKSQLRLSI